MPKSTGRMWNTGAPAGVHNLKCKELYMDAQEDMHMNDYNKITALYSRLSVGDEDRDGLRLAVYLKSKNAKKYRHGMEYGSARWSA